MLTNIDITHLATIKKLTLELSSGATVVTGETGAGKSILIDAIEFSLGGRATGDVVRAGQDKADISVVFCIEDLPHVAAWLQTHDLENGDECILRRVINKDGKSRCYINGTPSTLQLVRELSELLINIHGQHEHQTLFKQDIQRDMLDRYAGHSLLLNKVSELAHSWHTTAKQIENLSKQRNESNSRSEYLRFQLQELQDLQLGEDEFAKLDVEHKQLANSGELLQNINLALHLLADNEEHNILTSVNDTLDALEKVQAFEPKIAGWVENLKSIVINACDTESELRHYLENVDLDPERLQWIEQRISTLFDIARKYKVEPENLFSLQQQLAAELNNLDCSDERLVELENQLEKIEIEYKAVAKKLTDSRTKTAKKLTKEITDLIHELSLPHGKFNIKLVQEEQTRFSPYGLEKVVFEISTNIGQPLQPLAKVASGGELSRISLAIHVATAGKHTIPTLIFDEIDVGISGGTAEIVGKLLRRLGESHQLMCITHLPQVAAQGHHHLLVEKVHEATGTVTHVKQLDEKNKIKELARLLGGVKITKKTLEHATEMLEKIT